MDTTPSTPTAGHRTPSRGTLTVWAALAVVAVAAVLTGNATTVTLWLLHRAGDVATVLTHLATTARDLTATAL